MVVYLRDALDRKLAAGRAATTRPLRIRLPVRIAAASLAMRSIARLYLHRETFFDAPVRKFAKSPRAEYCIPSGSLPWASIARGDRTVRLTAFLGST